jgi:hypothetical protein
VAKEEEAEMDDLIITIQMRLGDARTVIRYTQLGMRWALREGRMAAVVEHHIGRGIYTILAAIESARAS